MDTFGRGLTQMHAIATLTRHACCAVRCMTSKLVENLPGVFVCPHEDDKSAVFETLNSGDHRRESTSLVPENGVYVCGRKAKTEEKFKISA